MSDTGRDTTPEIVYARPTVPGERDYTDTVEVPGREATANEPYWCVDPTCDADVCNNLDHRKAGREATAKPYLCPCGHPLCVIHGKTPPARETT